MLVAPPALVALAVAPITDAAADTAVAADAKLLAFIHRFDPDTAICTEHSSIFHPHPNNSAIHDQGAVVNLIHAG